MTEPMTEALVIKVGGAILEDDQQLQALLEQLAQLPQGFVLVHGGGRRTGKLAEQLGIPQQVVDGRRITDAATLELITMVYGGLIGRQLAAQLQGLGINALSLTGADGRLLPATKRPIGAIDYGFVGDVKPEHVNTELLLQLTQAGITPLVAPLTYDGRSGLLNTNADTMAATLATALAARVGRTRLVYAFEQPGVLQDVNQPGSLIHELSYKAYQAAVESGTINKGMLPKLSTGFQALHAGVGEVIIARYNALAAALAGSTTCTRLML